jgi:hypothetical protein
MADSNEALRRLHQSLIDKGLLMEAGWVSLRIAAIPPDAPKIQLDEMRTAFFAGAQHLFSSIMNMLDPETEETAADMRRMDMINDELNKFAKEFYRKHGIEAREH